MTAAQALSKVTISGRIGAQLRDRDGRVVYDREWDNLVVDGGLLRWMNLFVGLGSGPIVQMICGTGTNWPTPHGAMTALDSQPGGSVAKTFGGGDIVVAQPSTGVTTATCKANWAETENNFTINEVGLFCAGPLMVARSVVPSPGIPKTSALTLAFNYVITLTAS